MTKFQFVAPAPMCLHPEVNCETPKNMQPMDCSHVDRTQPWQMLGSPQLHRTKNENYGYKQTGSNPY